MVQMPTVWHGIVSIIVAGFAILLTERLPEFIRPTLQRKFREEIGGYDKKAEVFALSLSMMSIDFVSATGAIFGLFVSLVTEFWKDERNFGSVSSFVLLISALIAFPLAMNLSQMKWVDKSEDEYERTTGKTLKWVVRILSLFLIIISVLSSFMDSPVFADK